jgi:hypothetical protein
MWLMQDSARLPIEPGNGHWVSAFVNMCRDRKSRRDQKEACCRLLKHVCDAKPEQVQPLLAYHNICRSLLSYSAGKYLYIANGYVGRRWPS